MLGKFGGNRRENKLKAAICLRQSLCIASPVRMQALHGARTSFHRPLACRRPTQGQSARGTHAAQGLACSHGGTHASGHMQAKTPRDISWGKLYHFVSFLDAGGLVDPPLRKYGHGRHRAHPPIFLYLPPRCRAPCCNSVTRHPSRHLTSTSQHCTAQHIHTRLGVYMKSVRTSLWLKLPRTARMTSCRSLCVHMRRQVTVLLPQAVKLVDLMPRSLLMHMRNKVSTSVFCTAKLGMTSCRPLHAHTQEEVGLTTSTMAGYGSDI